MLSRCLCQVHKCVFLSNFKLNSINVATLARRIHSSAKKLSDSELKEQTVAKCETEELPPSTEDNNFGRLHTPVMLEEVVNCLSPQPGQVSQKLWSNLVAWPCENFFCLEQSVLETTENLNNVIFAMCIALACVLLLKMPKLVKYIRNFEFRFHSPVRTMMKFSHIK